MYAVLGEILYIISNYEKGRVNPSAFWNKHYVASLKKSLHIMSEIIQMLKKPYGVQLFDWLTIMDFCKKNLYTIFPKPNIDIENFCDNAVVFCSCVTDVKYLNVVEYMDNIIEECRGLLENKEYKYKLQIFYLLCAFHNLPRVFIDPDKQTFFCINTTSLCAKDAIDYSLSYIELQNKAKFK